MGPGSIACIHKVFGAEVRGRELDALRYLHRTQHDHFACLQTAPVDIPKLAGRVPGMTMVDIEHALCECEKYSRAYHPTIQGRRHKVGKRQFVPRLSPITDVIPAHWLPSDTQRMQTATSSSTTRAGGEPVNHVSHVVMERRGQARVDPSYLIRWVGYGPDEDTWVKQSTLVTGAAEVIERWESAKGRIEARTQELREIGSVYRS